MTSSTINTKWDETLISKDDFEEHLEGNEEMWEDMEGGVREALDSAKEFLALAKQKTKPEVVMLREGYYKLQSAALDRQKPPQLRIAAKTGLKFLPPPPQLYWEPSADGESGATAAAANNAERVPFGVVERCKLLEVQYVLKELRPATPPPSAPPSPPAASSPPPAAAAAAGSAGGSPRVQEDEQDEQGEKSGEQQGEKQEGENKAEGQDGLDGLELLLHAMGEQGEQQQQQPQQSQGAEQQQQQGEQDKDKSQESSQPRVATWEDELLNLQQQHEQQQAMEQAAQQPEPEPELPQHLQRQQLSFRIVLQRLPPAPLPDEVPGQDKGEDGSENEDAEKEQSEEGKESEEGEEGQDKEGSGSPAAEDKAPAKPEFNPDLTYTCTFEYPVFTLKSSDYLVPAEVFDRGLKSWQALRKGDAFNMPWDGEEYRGFAAGYRVRRLDDPFLGSPWWSIIVEWEGHSTDRKRDPEDWCYGNPWEMTREEGTGPPPLPDPQTALAAAGKAGHPVVAAPWTSVWAKAMKAAATRAEAKRKRARSTQFAQMDEDFVWDAVEAEDGDEFSDGADDVMSDLLDPTDFYFDDDADEFELHTEQRRKGSRSRNTGGGGSRRRRGGTAATSRGTSRSPTGGPSGGGKASQKAAAAAAAAAGELTHNYGREMMAPTGLCIVCGSSEGNLVSGHWGRSAGNCSRQFHSGCLLLLNAVGVRSVNMAKSQGKGKGRGGSSASSSRSKPLPATLAADADALCDGLLAQLRQQVKDAEGDGDGEQGDGGEQQQQQQQQQQQDGEEGKPAKPSKALVAAVAAAQEAAVRVASGELTLCCPSHGCHGCQLNGKLEFMVWCCCCWVRVYHHRQCVPYGAEHIQIGGRDFIRCPHCRAAGMPLPPAPAPLPPVAAAADDSVAAADGADDEPAAGAAADTGADADAAAAEAADGADTVMATDEAPAADAGDKAAAAAAGGVEARGSSTALDGVVAVKSEQQQQQAGSNADPQPQPKEEQQEAKKVEQGAGEQQQPQQSPAAAAAAAAAQSGGGGEPAGSSEPTGEQYGEPMALDDTDGDSEQQKARAALSTEQQQQTPTAKQPSAVAAALAAAASAAAAAAAAAAEGNEGDIMAALKHVANLDSQLQALLTKQKKQKPPKPAASGKQRQPKQQQQQQEGGSSQQQPPPQQQQQRQERQQSELAVSPSPSAAAAGAVAAATQALVAAAGPPPGSREPIMPPWLLLSLEDPERLQPSYALVPCSSDGFTRLTAGIEPPEEEIASAAVLSATAAVAGTLPPTASPAAGLLGYPVMEQTGAAALVAAAGDADDADAEAAAAAAEEELARGLPLASPHSHWLVGCLPKAEAQYRPSNLWGCAMIGVPTPDEAVYGLAVVADYLPSLQKLWDQLQQKQAEAEDDTATEDEDAPPAPPAAAAAAANGAAAAAAANGVIVPPARARPTVYLRCNKTVAKDGQMRLASNIALLEGEEKKAAGEWQVLVNGQPYPGRQGKAGLRLTMGDVITVQGLSFRLALAD